MIKITKTDWRPFIELHTHPNNNLLYFDINVRPISLITQEDHTEVILEYGKFLVKESAKDIIKAVDRLIKIEADRKLEEAKKYREETEARAARFQQQLMEKK
jgi:hypothetical protein